MCPQVMSSILGEFGASLGNSMFWASQGPAGGLRGGFLGASWASRGRFGASGETGPSWVGCQVCCSRFGTALGRVAAAISTGEQNEGCIFQGVRRGVAFFLGGTAGTAPDC